MVKSGPRILSCWRETKGRTIHEQGPTPVSDRPRFAGPERGPHCRQATADRLLMSSRPGQQVMTSSWCTTDANIILCPTDEFCPQFEWKSIYASKTDLYHNAVVPPRPSVCTTAPSQTSDDKMKPSRAIPPPIQTTIYLDHQNSSVLFARVRQTNKVKNRQPTKRHRALLYM